jgi:hypothetical protein
MFSSALWLREVEMSDFKFEHMQGGATGMDAFFENEPQAVSPFGQKAATVKSPARVKVGSLSQLQEFTRTASDQLVHKSTQDLWSIKREGGDFVIQRLFQDGVPVKG